MRVICFDAWIFVGWRDCEICNRSLNVVSGDIRVPAAVKNVLMMLIRSL